ncbi:hypothetical protein VTL71DRAFT_12337 [Oculimacula yallundae]|uniref:Uncharacterized protein n=1 Tax=Oculimacula yallundae TaxID=86028 RepID=A0ABR4CNJ6_9HELO
MAIMASGGIYALKTIDKSIARTQRSRNRNNNSNSSRNTLDNNLQGPPQYYDQSPNQNHNHGYWGPPPGPPPMRGYPSAGEGYADVYTQTRGSGERRQYGYGGATEYQNQPRYSYVQGPPPRKSSRSKKGRSGSASGERRSFVRSAEELSVEYGSIGRGGR